MPAATRPIAALFAVLLALSAVYSATIRFQTELHAGPLQSTANGFIQPFSLGDVALTEGSEFDLGQSLNHRYLLLLDPDNLLYNFRVTAALDAPGQSYGGWESSNVEVRGQFLGHYLSALAFACKSTGDDVFAKRGDYIVAGLAEVQAAYGDGYVSAFPKSHFDRLEALQPVWAPYYVIHKILAGLLDQYQLAGQRQALDVLTQAADYFCKRSARVIALRGIDHWHQVLENEFGGMNDVLYRLHLETGGSQWTKCAGFFDKPVWFDPMVAGNDTLSGLHANTHLAQINGFAARFEATGDESAAAAVSNFFRLVTHHHSYSTGGSNWYERWGRPESLKDAIDDPAKPEYLVSEASSLRMKPTTLAVQTAAAANTQESCTTYNILKIARSLFRWTANPSLVDFYERALLNGVIGVQRIDHRAHDHNHIADSLDRHHGGRHLHALHEHEIMESRMDAASGMDYHGVRSQQLSEAETAAIARVNVAHAEQPRPADWKAVFWPNDPASAIRTAFAESQRTDPAHAAAGQGVARGSEADDRAGQYIYYMPLGHEESKGNNPQAWTHGWGDKFNTFWCCYGTAVESFSKLADSIYFWRHAQSTTSTLQRRRLAATNENNAAVSRHPAELFVAQFASSTLTWSEQGVRVTQLADLYSSTDDVARTTLRLSLYKPSSSSQKAAARSVHDVNVMESRTESSSQGNVSFFLHWRLPSWTIEEGVKVRINGQLHNVSEYIGDVPNAMPESSGFGQSAAIKPASLDRSRLKAPWLFPQQHHYHPPFGKGARWVTMGPEWQDGDEIAIEMPMKVRVEELNDARQEARSLKALVMGPFQMAGLTDGPRGIDVDPGHVSDAISLPDTSHLVSLAVGKKKSHDFGKQHELSNVLLRTGKNEKNVEMVGKEALKSRGDDMAATWHISLQRLACDSLPGTDTWNDDGALHRSTPLNKIFDNNRFTAAQLHNALCARGGAAVASHRAIEEDAVYTVSFENMLRPGTYLCWIGTSGELASDDPATLGVGTCNDEQDHGHDKDDVAAVSRVFVVKSVTGSGDFSLLRSLELGGSYLQEIFERFKAGIEVEMTPLESVMHSGGGEVAPPGLKLALVAAAASKGYPPGSRIFTGKREKYVIAPIGQLIDERYTAYFEFTSVAPSA